MFIPLHDSNSLDHIDRQYVTIGLIVVNVAIWLVTALAPSESFAEASAMGLGFIPA